MVELRVDRVSIIHETTGPQMQWHRKPNGGLCDVCGCGGKLRKGVEHRALTPDEAHCWRASYIKRVSDAYGRDTMIWALDVDGVELHQGVTGV